MSHKGLKAVLAGTVVLIVALGYFAWKGKQASPAIETVGWKTYTRNDPVFSFSYPGSWKEPIVNQQSTRVLIDFGNGFSVTTGLFYNQTHGRNDTVSEIVNGYKNSSTIKDLTIKNTIIDDHVAFKLEYYGTDTKKNYTDVYIVQDQQIQENFVELTTDESIDNEVFNKILSTFKFTNSESEIISKLKNNWQSIQVSIPFRPTHPGTTIWGSPDTIQFIGKSTVLVRFEDGYNPGLAVLNFTEGKFKILETFKNQGDFTLAAWQGLITKYSDLSYPVATYTMSLLRNKEIVSFQELTRVPENVLVKNYWDSWKTYTNTQYGFEFKYPADFIVLENADFSSDNGAQVTYPEEFQQYISISSAIVGVEGKTLVTVAIPDSYFVGRNAFNAFFNVSVQENSSESNCYSKSTVAANGVDAVTVPLQSQRNINGTVYYEGETSGAGLSHQAENNFLHIFKQNRCIEINIEKRTTSAIDGDTDEMRKANDVQMSVFDHVLSTFKFIK